MFHLALVVVNQVRKNKDIINNYNRSTILIFLKVNDLYVDRHVIDLNYDSITGVCVTINDSYLIYYESISS